MKRIVIIHGGAIGDLVQALPTLAAVRTTWPTARVTLVGRPERAALARLAGVVDETADIETSGLWRLTGESADGPLPPVLAEADLVVDFLSKGALAAGLARRRGAARVVWADPLPPAGWCESAAAWIAREVGGKLPLTAAATVPPAIPVWDGALAAARALLVSRGVEGRFVAVHPGSGSPKKNWPMPRFAAVAERVRSETGRTVVWLAGPAELERGTLPVGEPAVSDLQLEQVAAVLALAEAYLGNDSGITQVAGAVRRGDGRATPTVAVFGPSDARVWAPRGGHVRVVVSDDGTMEGAAEADVWAALAWVFQ